MFKYLHGYNPRTFDAVLKSGLFGENDGLRFCQSILLEDNMKFNRLAAKNGGFYRFVKENRVPFYIDRLQGGCYIDEYKYDKALLDDYGDLFLGMQMHEWLSNYQSDLKKLEELTLSEWTEQGILDEINRKFKTPTPFLESMTAKELAQSGIPSTKEEFCRNMMGIYKKRTDEYGKIIPCDSAFLAFPFEIESGAAAFMPEIGGQTADARLQICFARGCSKVSGVPFGAYYEPWTPRPCSACCYQKDRLNEWGITDPKDFPFETCGPNGGSSRSLQKRLLAYAYLNNAAFISEEWGVCNTFIDWNDFELSEYGTVVRDFLRFTRKYNDVGDKLAPVAAVLPHGLQVLEQIHSYDTFCGYRCENGEAEKLAIMKRGLETVFSAKSGPVLGSETKGCMINSDVPDAVDVFCAGNDGVIAQYDYIVDLTGDPAFSAKHGNIAAPGDVSMLLKKALPCYVEGGLHWMVNKCTSGGYYLSVFNNDGVVRNIEEGERVLPEAEKTVAVTFRDNAVPALKEGCGKLSRRGDNSYYITVAGGDWCFIKF